MNDNDQQVAFKRETEKLWQYSQANDLFTFRTVGDVLQENQELKAEIKWLNDGISVLHWDKIIEGDYKLNFTAYIFTKN